MSIAVHLRPACEQTQLRRDVAQFSTYLNGARSGLSNSSLNNGDLPSGSFYMNASDRGRHAARRSGERNPYLSVFCKKSDAERRRSGSERNPRLSPLRPDRSADHAFEMAIRATVRRAAIEIVRLRVVPARMGRTHGQQERANLERREIRYRQDSKITLRKRRSENRKYTAPIAATASRSTQTTANPAPR